MSRPAEQASEHLIEVRDLVTQYGKRRILEGINLRVRRGEILVIMGSSGSGKTTLLRHLLGLSRPSSGSIRLFGEDITKLRGRALFRLRKNLGVAFQSGALLGSLSLRENVELPLREHTKLDERTIRIMSRMKLEMMNLSGFEDLMPSELSGGMVKRAALARAVIMDPKLLFFDEPTAGLDPVVAAELDELILRLRAALGITVVVVTHDLESAMKIADRIAIIYQGKILVIGTVEEIQACEHLAVQDMLNRKPREHTLTAEEYLELLTREDH